jgi:COMPASS component SPP1
MFPTAVARSRSTSTMAGGSAALETDSKVEGVKDLDLENDEAGEKEEDKLYCVCKTRYDEDRVMIACDRCVSLGWTLY